MRYNMMKTAFMVRLLSRCSVLLLALLTSTQTLAGIQEDVLRVVWKDLRPPVDKTVVKDYRNGAITKAVFDTYMEGYGRKIITDYDNQLVKIPGYLVPLNMRDDMTATRFLLVPTAGACVHVPPPSPNQIVYIEYEKGMAYEETAMYPYWVYGKLTSTMTTSEYSDAMYSMKAELVTDYITW
ncbi:DUF3299 domain-containing protein [Kistimonas scapharcae]|uniref:DUF3299 domain-containing protein n=2 Tax=Kistimonas scapharcae TaxID=1036133 RepID=A0ABP8V3Q3_9GAMM